MTTTTTTRNGARTFADRAGLVLLTTGILAGTAAVGAPSADAAETHDWSKVIKCESGGDPRATNPSGKYLGLLQFSRPTWLANKPADAPNDPRDATLAQTIAAAETLLAKAGDEQWPECGDLLQNGVTPGMQAATAPSPAPAPAPAQAPAAAPAPAQAASGELKGASAVLGKAAALDGTRYTYGGTTVAGGLDCSGFTQMVFREAGINLPRVSKDQAKAGTAVAGGLANARPGDLLAFDTNKDGVVNHVAVYAGNGKMWDSPHTGSKVGLRNVYASQLVDVRRVLDGAAASAPAATPAPPVDTSAKLDKGAPATQRALPPVPPPAPAGQGQTAAVPANGVLDLGDKSDQVLQLQRFMTKAFPTYNRYEPTGYFGTHTDTGVREFQKRTGLVVDGKVGPKTKAKLAEFGLKLDGTPAVSQPAKPVEQPAKPVEQAQTVAAPAAASVVHPAPGTRLTSTFGPRWGTTHAGVDFAGAIGTPIKSTVDGTIIRAGQASGFGLAVYVKDDNGFVHTYGHVNEIIKSSGRVKAGDTIATLGNRGQSTGPHLHYEVHKPGTMYGTNGAVDPLGWLRGKGLGI